MNETTETFVVTSLSVAATLITRGYPALSVSAAGRACRFVFPVAAKAEAERVSKGRSPFGSEPRSRFVKRHGRIRRRQ